MADDPDYALRSLGIGERLLPAADFTFCQQATLIGSGMIWNIYFGTISLVTGFVLATFVALGKGARNPWLRKPSEWFVFVFRGSPLFIQFFFGYFAFLSLKQSFPIFDPFTSAFLGAAVVLFLNTRPPIPPKSSTAPCNPFPRAMSRLRMPTACPAGRVFAA